MKTLTRRGFLRITATLGFGATLAACLPKATPQPEPTPRLEPTPRPEPTKAQPTPTTQNITTPTAQRKAVATQEKSPTSPPDTPTNEVPKPSATPSPTPVPPQASYLAVVRGDDPEAITMRAIAAIGGIERFVKSGYDVIIKPNICNAYHGPEYASTTNPQVVATLVKLCLGAGAKQVRVLDYPFAGDGKMAYATSEIGPAVEAAGGEMEIMAGHKFVDYEIPEGRDLAVCKFYQPVLDADLVINVPIAKHHNLARLTLGGKNLMGVIADRGQIHRNLGQRIADITSRVRPQLTVVDAVRILVKNGPTGGNLNDVKQMNTVIASHDIVAADAYATTLFDLTPGDIDYIVASADMGLGTLDLDSVDIAELNI